MIRFKLLFFILFSVILLAGCSENDSSYTEEPGAKTYLQLYIPRTHVQSRTTGSPTTPGTPEENAISDITIYLMDNGERLVKMENISMSGTSSHYISDLIPIDRDLLNQELQIFLVANPNKADLTVRTSQGFKGVYSTQADTYQFVTPGQMVMSNQVEQNPAPTILITRENTRENPARATVLLDRLAVKIVPQVSINFSADFSGRKKESAFFEGFTFSVEAAGLLNAATEFNLEQVWSNGADGQPIQLLSPTWYYKPEASYFSKYDQTIEEYTNPVTAPFVVFNEKEENGYRLISSPFYCLENNSPFFDYTGSGISPENQVKTKYKGLATGVIFKIQATKDGNAATFYRYEGEYYTDTPEGRTELATVAGLNPEDFGNLNVLRGKDIQVYEEGYIYYSYWIKDINSAYSGEDYDLSYSIIRNSSYLLRANGLSRIGDDIPGGGYDPSDPIDKIEQIEIIAVAQDWTLVDVTHNFN